MKEPSPAFSFYPADFLADEQVSAMTFAERGLYITLLCHAWREGSIPSELSEIARLVREPVHSLKRLWAHVAPCFRARSDGRLIQPRLEETRQKQIAHREKQAENGKQGGRPRLLGNKAVGFSGLTQNKAVGFSGLTQTEAKKSLSSSSSTSSSFPDPDPDLAAAAAASVVADYPRAYTREDELAFACWFIERGIASGAIPPDRASDPEMYARRESLDDARALLDTYGRAECEARANRLFAARAEKKITRQASIHALRECWDWREIEPQRMPVSPPQDPGLAKKIECMKRFIAKDFDDVKT